MTAVLSVRSATRAKPVRQNQFVRLKRKPYKDDLAKVVEVRQAGMETKKWDFVGGGGGGSKGDQLLLAVGEALRQRPRLLCNTECPEMGRGRVVVPSGCLPVCLRATGTERNTSENKQEKRRSKQQITTIPERRNRSWREASEQSSSSSPGSISCLSRPTPRPSPPGRVCDPPSVSSTRKR